MPIVIRNCSLSWESQYYKLIILNARFLYEQSYCNDHEMEALKTSHPDLMVHVPGVVSLFFVKQLTTPEDMDDCI